MMKYCIAIWVVFITMLMSACRCPANVGESVSSDSANIWKVTLQEKIPLLGHRNWIVVTDMAYPLQNKPGITTLFANDAYPDVLFAVQGMIHHSPHISATIYQDKEFLSLNDKVCPGIDSLKIDMREVFPSEKITYKEHEQLIATLDSVSNLFQVVIIKTPLTKPYTSVFFELGCKYWPPQ